MDSCFKADTISFSKEDTVGKKEMIAVAISGNELKLNYSRQCLLSMIKWQEEQLTNFKGETMKIVDQKVELLNHLSYEETLYNIEMAGRICYQSKSDYNIESGEKFVRMIIKRGHESVLEHGSLTFKIKTNRAIANEIVRHRLASYSQESTRYVKYNHIDFIPWIDRVPVVNKAYMEYILEDVEEHYARLIQDGCKAEDVRDILPLCTATRLAMTMNFRELRHFLKLRLDKAAHPQIRELANMILKTVEGEFPVLVEDIEGEEEHV